MFIDTHAHLYAEEFDQDREAMLQRARTSGLSHLFLPNIDRDSIEPMHRLCDAHADWCFPMMGLHPCSVNASVEEELAICKQWLDQRKYVAIGEIGIDLYWDKTFFAEQQYAFRTQIQWAKERSLPIVIHARDSFSELFEIVDELNDERLKGIFHCFTGDESQAKHILNYGGFLLGIGGVVTFKSSTLPQVLKHVPLEKLVLETDSPYLAPVPHRGKRNEPSYLTAMASKLSELYERPIKDIAEITSSNALRMFGLPLNLQA
jgi:TatD DNase family protein